MFTFDNTMGTVPGTIVLVAKATLLLVIALGASAVLQRASAGARHLVWVGILGAIVMLPALSVLSPVRLPILPAQITRATPPLPAEAPASTPVFDRERIPSVATPAAPAENTSPATQAVSVPRITGWQVALLVWSCIAAAVALWLAYGFFSVRRIVRRSQQLETRDWVTPLYEIADRLGIDEAPRLMRSEDVRMPFACGLITPTIVLPAESDAWTAERRSAVLMHELAHIRRRDILGHTLGRIACAIYWFHPLVWTAARRLRIESERACDDLALTSGLRATNYAEHLLDIVSGIRRPHTPAAAIPMAQRREFEGRMLAILDPDLRRRAGRVQSLSLLGAVAVLVVVVSAAVPASRAQDLESSSQNVSTVRIADGDSATTKPVDRTDIADQEPAVAVERRQRDTAQSARTESRRQTEPAPGADTDADLSALGLQQLVMQGKRGDDRATLLMQVLRSDTSRTLRRVAAWGLSNHADRAEVGTALATALRRDGDAEVREMAAWSLASGEDAKDVMDALSDALRRDADHEVREMAAWALGNLGSEQVVDALSAALGDSSAVLRSTALWALGNSGLEKAPRGVIAALRDPDKRVRRLAAWTLYNIEDAETVAPLEAALNGETEKDLRTAYIRALGAIGGESADALGRLLDSPDPEVRAVVVNALAGRAAGPWPWPNPRPRPYP